MDQIGEDNFDGTIGVSSVSSGSPLDKSEPSHMSMFHPPSHTNPSEPSLGRTCLIATEAEWHRMAGPTLEPIFPLSYLGQVQELLEPCVHALHDHYIMRVRRCQHGSKSKFRRTNVPAISLLDYFVRIRNYVVALEPVVLLAVLVYADRLDSPEEELTADGGFCDGKLEFSSHPNQAHRLVIDAGSVHRFVIASICVASKALGDFFYANAYYAKVGGIGAAELACLETELARLLDWRLQCTRRQLAKAWSLTQMYNKN